MQNNCASSVLNISKHYHLLFRSYHFRLKNKQKAYIYFYFYLQRIFIIRILTLAFPGMLYRNEELNERN